VVLLDEQEKCPCYHVGNNKRKIKIKKVKRIEFCSKKRLLKRLWLRNIKLRQKKSTILLCKHLLKLKKLKNKAINRRNRFHKRLIRQRMKSMKLILDLLILIMLKMNLISYLEVMIYQKKVQDLMKF